MTQSTASRLADIHARAMQAFDAIYAQQRDEREQCVADRRFATIAGAQWEGDLGAQFANVPRFEFNKIALAILRILNEYRNNRISVDFRAKDEDSSDELAETLNGLYRADEQDSGGQEAYDNSFDESTTGGFGAYRFRCEYEDEYDADNDRQRIKIEPIFDADTSVYFDLDAKRQDKADAKKCFVITGMSPSGYEDAYPDHPMPASFPKPIPNLFEWFVADVVYVAEYYEVDERTEKISIFRGLTPDMEEQRVSQADLTPEKQAELDATGWKLSRIKKVKKPCVYKYVINGAEVIEDCGMIAGPNIPIVPEFGKRWYIDSIERMQGHVRTSKDAQRLKNMQLSRLGEIAALSPIEKPILYPEQVAGHELLWANDNITNNPFLLINPVMDANGQQIAAGPIGYTKAPSIPEALGALLQMTETDMQDLLGGQQAGETLEPNTSGKAVELVQKRLDMQTFVYMDNAAKARKRGGEIWLGMAREVYVEDGRKMKSVNEQGESDFITLNKPTIDPDTLAEKLENDLSDGRYDVWVDVGPSFSSRKDATVRGLLGMMQVTGAADQELTGILASTAVLNMDGEGMKDVQKFLRMRNLQRGIGEPTEDEAKELAEKAQNTPPDPNAQYLQAAAAESGAKAQKAGADTALAIANTKKAEADTAATLAAIPVNAQAQAIKSAQALHEMLKPDPAPAN